MPVASEEQVPKPLTYTLMYHLLWAVMFGWSALVLGGVFVTLGRPVASVLWLVLLTVLSGVGALVTYSVRIQVLLGELSKAEAFRWSEASSAAVLIFAPLAFMLWFVFIDPHLRSAPAQMTAMMVKVELVIWWLSHLLSIRGLARGRKKYLSVEATSGEAGKSSRSKPEQPVTTG
jgi:hypothetical protein